MKLLWREVAVTGMGARRHRFAAAWLCLALLASAAAASLAAAAAVHLVVQRGRAFTEKIITLAAGDSLHFANEDSFIHQIFIDSPALQFDSPEQLPGQFIDVTFAKPGHYTVLCHIHPRMRLDVTVQ
jgi:plastocyanin